MKSITVPVLGTAPNGPWVYDIQNVPAVGKLTATVEYTGPWSLPGAVFGEGMEFTLAPNTAAVENLQLNLHEF